ncbi:MAG TPA: type II secretion system protein GspG [Acidobacteriota bacterium]
MFCTCCGAKVKEGQGFCTSCGARLSVGAGGAPEITRTAAPAKKSSIPTGVIVAIVIGAFMLLGIVSAIAIPSLLMAREKAKLKATMHDMSQISMALTDYVTDNGTTPAQDGSLESGSVFFKSLAPFYIKVIPPQDHWKHNYLVYCGEACNGHYGLSDAQDRDYLVVSLGRDGIQENWQYDPNNPDSGLFPVGSLSDYSRDLVWYSGVWIRAPQGYR